MRPSARPRLELLAASRQSRTIASAAAAQEASCPLSWAVTRRRVLDYLASERATKNRRRMSHSLCVALERAQIAPAHHRAAPIGGRKWRQKSHTNLKTSSLIVVVVSVVLAQSLGWSSLCKDARQIKAMQRAGVIASAFCQCHRPNACCRIHFDVGQSR